MRDDSQIKESWEALHKQARFRPKFPAEPVVRFRYVNFPREKSKARNFHVLDVGMGGGRHVRFFAIEGFNIYGTDVSREAVKHCREMIKEEDLQAKLVQAEMTQLPYDDESFHGFVSYGVFYYGNKVTMKKAIAEMYRVLKPGGKGLVITRTVDDYRYGKGKRTERNTYTMRLRDTNEFNMPIHFLAKRQIPSYFAGFKHINIERNDFTQDNMRILNSDWIITVEK